MPSAPITASAIDRCAIGKCQANAIADLIESDQLVVEPDHLIGNGAGERRMQVAAMRQQIRRAELLLGALAKNHVELDFAGAPVAVVPGARIERLRAQARFQSEAAQHLHGVAADLDAGAEPRELRRLFVDGDVDADLPQRRRGSQARPCRRR